MEYPNLFKPVAIGNMQLKNRIVMPAMGTNFASTDGHVTDRLIDYYVERAKGGIGLITTEVTSIALEGGNVHAQLSVHDDCYIPGLKRLTDAVHAASARIALQLHHSGRRGGGPLAVGPSAISYLGGPPVRELSIAEIEGIVEAYGRGARRAREAGFDAVELHCTHAYLIAQFMSLLTNKRTDGYGGSLENRMRLGFEALESIRSAVGKDYPVICRITGEEGIDGGITVQDAQTFARGLVQRGADSIHVSAGGVPSNVEELKKQQWRNLPVVGEPAARFECLWTAIKEVVPVPIIGVGKINTPALAERIIAEGKADLVAIGRGVIADAYWAKKAEEGRDEDVRPCLYCSECNDSLIARRSYVDCSINPTVGRETAFALSLAPKTKLVAVIGAGPAGMEAARVAAERGHEVTLYEKLPELGGMLRAACISKGKDGIAAFGRFQERQARKANVKVVVGCELTPDDVLKLEVDAVIVATGAEAALPEIPGITGKNVCTGVDVLLGKVPLGDRPVVVGGGMVGCEAAEYLAERGKIVRLVTRRGEDGLAIGMSNRARQWFLHAVWSQLNVEVIPFCQFTEVVDGGLLVTDRQGASKLIAGDMVVFCTGMAANNKLAEALHGKVPELHVVGDCISPRKIMEAVREGYEAGLKV